MDLDTAVAEVFREIRIEKGFTQRELAFRCGIDPMTISRIERGERLPSLVTLLQIATACGLSGNELIRRVEHLQPEVAVAEPEGSSYAIPPKRKGKKR